LTDAEFIRYILGIPEGQPITEEDLRLASKTGIDGANILEASIDGKKLIIWKTLEYKAHSLQLVIHQTMFLM
jgi:hypothetical protein